MGAHLLALEAGRNTTPAYSTSPPEALDRTQQAREALDEKGLTYTDRFGAPRSRPEIAVERDNKLIFARLLAALDLDAEPPPSPLSLRPYRRRS